MNQPNKNLKNKYQNFEIIVYLIEEYLIDYETLKDIEKDIVINDPLLKIEFNKFMKEHEPMLMLLEAQFKDSLLEKRRIRAKDFLKWFEEKGYEKLSKSQKELYGKILLAMAKKSRGNNE